MSKSRNEKKAKRATKRAAKAAAMKNPGFKSKYAIKHRWLSRHGLWGWEVPEPKPWKTGD